MAIYRINSIDGYPYKLNRVNPPPVPEEFSHVHYGYRWHPFRLMMYDHLTKFFPDAHIVEEIRAYEMYGNYVGYTRGTITVRIYITRTEKSYQQDPLARSFVPVWNEVDQGGEMDLETWYFPVYAPPLERARFHHLTQSFPDDIVIPQSRRYR